MNGSNHTNHGRAIALAVGHWLPTAAARVRSQVMWVLWWALRKMSPSTSVSPANSLSPNSFILTYHPRLVL
jgi:hypothetical protein